MNSWTMRFRVGNGGTSMWPLCLKYHVAAITYYPVASVDLRNFSKEYLPKQWEELSPSQKFSLFSVAFEMKEGDIIYVRDKGKIIAMGKVTSSYFFDKKKRIIDDNEVPWAHQVSVDWRLDFPETSSENTGPTQFTVWRLKADELKAIEATSGRSFHQAKVDEAMEGELFKKEATFKSRNRLLIQSKKALSNYRCEVCDFNFSENYGSLGKEYIIAHHLEPIGQRKELSKTTLDDIALLCANCHSMAHKKNPPVPLENLKKAKR